MICSRIQSRARPTQISGLWGLVLIGTSSCNVDILLLSIEDQAVDRARVAFVLAEWKLSLVEMCHGAALHSSCCGRQAEECE